MQQTLALSVQETLPMFKTNKYQRQDFAKEIVEQIEEGNLDPLKVHLSIKAMEDVAFLLSEKDPSKNKYCFELAKKYREALYESAKQYGAKSFEFEAAKFTIMETGVQWDYSKCNDPLIIDLHNQKKELAEKIKEREKFLQMLPQKGIVVTDEETGDTNTIYPAAKSSTTSVSVSLK